MRIPVVILSYNRPFYLEQVLLSIKLQKKVKNKKFEFFLFQDVPPFEYDFDKEKVYRCESIFKTLFPKGKILRANGHQGIDFNYNRAENYVFSFLKSPLAFFFEDDLVLNSNYFEILDKLSQLAMENSIIGTVTAAGSLYTLPLKEQKAKRSELCNAGFSWGFALTRKHWVERKLYTDKYLEIVNFNRYTYRDTQKIWQLYESLGFGKFPTSQDRAKSLITNYLGRLRLSTNTINAKYIGEQGVHFTKDLFSLRGFNEQVVNNSYEHCDFPISAIELTCLIKDESRRLKNYKHQNHKWGLSISQKRIEQLVSQGNSIIPKGVVIKAPIDNGVINCNFSGIIFNYKGSIKQFRMELKASSFDLKLFIILIDLDEGTELIKRIISREPISLEFKTKKNIQLFLVKKCKNQGFVDKIFISILQ